MGKGKRKQDDDEDDVPDAPRDSKQPRVDGASSSSSATMENGGGNHGSPEDVTSDEHSVLTEPPPPQASTGFIGAQGEPPTGDCKWNFNLEESPFGTPGGTLTLPPVPPDWIILEALPSEEERATLPEALFMAMVRCFAKHHMVG